MALNARNIAFCCRCSSWSRQLLWLAQTRS